MSNKTQEIEEIFTSEYQNIMNKNEYDNDDKKDEEIIINALKRMKKKGKNIKQFMWKTMSELCYQNDQQITNDFDDEKKFDHHKRKQIKTSQLINIKNNEMCTYGHGYFLHNKDIILDTKCIQCSSMIERKYCLDCSHYDKNDWSASVFGADTDIKQHIYCVNCRKTNSDIIKKRIKINKMKSVIIRIELIQNAILERDLLCNMQRRTAVDELIYDINNLSVVSRGHWILLLFDMDDLNAWNTAIGHISTDKLLKQIGNIMRKYIQEINNGKWINKKDRNESLLQAFIYRAGSDEFVMAIRCQSAANCCKLYKFYNSFKTEINVLGSNIKQFVNKNEWKEMQKKLKKAKNKKGKKINLNIVGLSCGIFIPDDRKNRIKDWLSITDKIALEKAKNSNGINKNGCAIFYERINDVIPTHKVLKCLKMGVEHGLSNDNQQ